MFSVTELKRSKVKTKTQACFLTPTSGCFSFHCDSSQHIITKALTQSNSNERFISWSETSRPFLEKPQDTCVEGKGKGLTSIIHVFLCQGIKEVLILLRRLCQFNPYIR